VSLKRIMQIIRIWCLGALLKLLVGLWAAMLESGMYPETVLQWIVNVRCRWCSFEGFGC
jgi:hypothetical protein